MRDMLSLEQRILGDTIKDKDTIEHRGHSKSAYRAKEARKVQLLVRRF